MCAVTTTSLVDARGVTTRKGKLMKRFIVAGAFVALAIVSAGAASADPGVVSASGGAVVRDGNKFEPGTVARPRVCLTCDGQGPFDHVVPDGPDLDLRPDIRYDDGLSR